MQSKGIYGKLCEIIFLNAARCLRAVVTLQEVYDYCPSTTILREVRKKWYEGQRWNRPVLLRKPINAFPFPVRRLSISDAGDGSQGLRKGTQVISTLELYFIKYYSNVNNTYIRCSRVQRLTKAVHELYFSVLIH